MTKSVISFKTDICFNYICFLDSNCVVEDKDNMTKVYKEYIKKLYEE